MRSNEPFLATVTVGTSSPETAATIELPGIRRYGCPYSPSLRSGVRSSGSSSSISFVKIRSVRL